MIVNKPFLLYWNDKTYSIVRTVRTDKQAVAEAFRDYLGAEWIIQHDQDLELWFICNEVKEAQFRDLEEDETDRQDSNN